MTRRLTLPAPIRLAVVAALAIALAGTALVLVPKQDGHEVGAATKISRSGFHDAMRVLWEDHIVWTRMAIVGILDDRPDQASAVDRLLRNQDDIGDAIKPFYGDEAGEQLSTLLRAHITGAADLLIAARSGDDDAVGAALTAWRANGDEIAAFLATANPNQWPLAEMKPMMRDHLDLTLDEAIARLEGRFVDDIAAYDAIHGQILHMADMLSDGIIAQFPSHFTR